MSTSIEGAQNFVNSHYKELDSYSYHVGVEVPARNWTNVKRQNFFEEHTKFSRRQTTTECFGTPFALVD